MPYEIHDDDVVWHSPVYRMLFPVVRMRTLFHELDRDLAPVDSSAGLENDAEAAGSELSPKLVPVNKILKEIVIVGKVRGYSRSQDSRGTGGINRPQYLQCDI